MVCLHVAVSLTGEVAHWCSVHYDTTLSIGTGTLIKNSVNIPTAGSETYIRNARMCARNVSAPNNGYGSSFTFLPLLRTFSSHPQN